ncbi:winged helix-turn-helix domain-containing protein [Meiothermus cerbereus]|jgi:restriction system protein|uniref:winged helix-turn-helix domain-containing protein n=1 Tax=Meiothermus cerbereus TaxID=65552 RepID=UPI003EE94FE5
MPIPNYQRFMYPLLEMAADGEAHSMDEAYEVLAEKFNLTEEDRAELLPSGRQSRYENRVGWARTYLTKAGLLESPGRGQFKITPRGLDVLKSGITDIDKNYLYQFPEFVEFRRRDRGNAESEVIGDAGKTPDEQLELLYLELEKQLAHELLERIKQCPPAFFERLVIQLLVAMGYGGSVSDAGKAVGRSGDDGIDGIIKQDRLGLSNIYIQAKRWNNTVPSEVVRTFAGSLALKKASRGVIITTSDFSKGAIETAERLGNIVLIDGETLAQYMIEYNVGVTVAARYEIKRIDRDFFEEI